VEGGDIRSVDMILSWGVVEYDQSVVMIEEREAVINK